jgi:signal transduction histidine kinase
MCLDCESVDLDIQVESRLASGLARLREGCVTGVLLDLNLPDSQGIETLIRVESEFPEIPIIVLTGQEDEAMAVEAVKQGAQDYLIKGTVDGNQLVRSIRYALERKRIEELLKKRTEDLERSNRDLEQFAYVAAHDLREPLVAVAAYLKVLERLSKNPVEDMGRTCIAKAINLVLRMDNMLQGLLAYSRLTLTPMSYELTDCNTCLADALSNLGLSIKKSGAAVTSDTLPTLKIDASQLVLIFQNLIGNAIKYRDSEPVTVHVGCISKESQYQFSAISLFVIHNH